MTFNLNFLKLIKVRIALSFSFLFLAVAIPAIIYAFNQVNIFFEGMYLQQMRVASLTARALSNSQYNPDSLVIEISEITATSVFLISKNGQLIASHYYNSQVDSAKLFSEPIMNPQPDITDNVLHKFIDIGINRYLKMQTELASGDKLLQVKSFSTVSSLKARMREVIIWSSFLGLLALIAVAFWVSANITKQLEKLTKLAQKIRLGESPEKIEIKSPDEVGDLADALNEIVDNLNQAKSALVMMENTQRNYSNQIGKRLEQPLLTIKTELEAIRESSDSLNSGNMEQLNGAIKQLGIVREIISTLIEISQLEFGDIILNFRKIPLGDLISKVVKQLEWKAQRKGLCLETVFTSDNIYVHADEKWLTVALGNLISNAIEYTEDGFIRIICDTKNEIVSIKIEDSGRGIPRDQINNIFERFYQVESKDIQNGVGLGLTLAKEIIRAHGHKLDVESKFGVGSHFSFSLKGTSEPN